MAALASPPPALLLLPPPPTPSTRLALNSSYHAPLSAVLSTLAAQSRQTRQPILLLIAVAAPVLAPGGGGGGNGHRKSVVRWHAAQSLLAGVYSVVAALCAEQGIQADMGATATASAPSVDARVVLVDHARGRSYGRTADGSFQTFNGTTVLDLAGFATLVAGPWERIFHPSSEAGYELLRAYLLLAEGKQIVRQSQIVAVPGGISISSPESTTTTTTTTKTAQNDDEQQRQDKSYETVILGGTFDHLHPGHKLLLHGTVLLMQLPDKHATTQTSTLIIGVSGDPMLQNKKFASELESWDTRCRSVFAFLASTFNVSPPGAQPAAAAAAATSYRVEDVAEGPSGGRELHGLYADGAVRVRCTVLNDPFGPTVDEEPIGAICVSGETRGGGRAVNDRRAAKGWHALDSYEVDVLDTRGIVEAKDGGGEEDFTAKISSTVIRQQRAEAKAKAQI
ncbi:hypothetical protein PWT90_07234 [Aphanocladium album]|nr:hypothetical protein PWT90_07234 [Aphanocladium album]